MNQLQDEIKNLNFQLSSISIQRSTTADKIKDYEREIIKHQTLFESKDTLLKDLQRKYDEQRDHLHSTEEQHVLRSNEQQNRIELLSNEFEQIKKKYSKTNEHQWKKNEMNV